MKLVDLAIDVAALLSASRSVASKHLALRRSQLDAYSRGSGWTSSATWRVDQKPKPKTEQGQPKSTAARDAETAAGRYEAASTGSAEAEPKKNGNLDPSSQPHIAGNFTERTDAAVAPTSAPPPLSTSTSSIEGTDSKPILPPDIDVNVFHTASGSKMLASLRANKNVAESARPAGGPAKEHPLRYWPHTAPPQVEKGGPASDAAANCKFGNAASQRTQGPSSSSELVENDEKTTKADHPLAQQPIPGHSKVANSQEALKNELPPRTQYALRESKVPSSRLGRLWNYGGLAAGMLGGAVSESVSRAMGGSGQGSVLLGGKNTERLVARLSRMRGAALKLGQMMSFQDSKLLPPPLQEVLQRVQDRADTMPAWQRDRVLVSNLGEKWQDLFLDFEEQPMAAASIGQVHRARLRSSGKRVAVKIQFPGVAEAINSDLDNLGMLLAATKLLPPGLYLDRTIDNARRELGWECDYEREAKCAIRFKELLRGDEEDVFVVPDVHPEASGKQVLTMDFMSGVGVTRDGSLTQEQRDWIGTQMMRLCLREMTEFRFMQTDPNWTNFLYNASLGKLELLDFGASREYPDQFARTYVQLLAAASRSDSEAVEALSRELGYLTGHESKAMVEAHCRSVLTLAEPFLATAPDLYDFRDQTITERVKALIPLMLRERLVPPPEETYSLHRKLSGAFLLCARLGSRVPCRDLFAAALQKSSQY